MTLRIVVVEDDPRYRLTLEKLFRGEPEFELVDIFAAAEPMIEALTQTHRRGEAPRWDLVLMDVDLPGTNGIEATRRIKAVAPALAVVNVTVFDEPGTILSAICAGADGYLLKSTTVDDMIEQLKAIAAGGSPLTPGVARTILGFVRQSGGDAGSARSAAAFRERDLSLLLSDREQEVLRDLARGLSGKQIAAMHDISIHTVRTYVRRIYEKMQVGNVAEAVAAAIRAGVV